MHSSTNNLLNIKNELNNINSKINIIAVSKNFNIEKIMPLIEFGHMHYGENKVQEAVDKWTALKQKDKRLKLHMIGKLQTNKVKFVIPLFDYIHSLDNLKLAEKIFLEQKKINKSLKIFIQVNIGKEDQKSGLDIKNVEEFYRICLKSFNLNIVGLMCIPPITGNMRDYFNKMLELKNLVGLKELSMGMSNDYLEAANCGASFLRIGSKIFGERN